MQDPRFYALALHHLPEVGAITYRKLVTELGCAERVFNTPIDQLESLLKPTALECLSDLTKHSSASLLSQKVMADLAWLDASDDRHLLALDDPNYPQLLRETHNAPPLLFVRGNIDCLSLPQIAIVGSRTPSAGGRDNAYRFAEYLASHGFTVTSGLAMGVDGAAHEGALAAEGKTIAVMGTGIDKIYPSRHRNLAQQILDKGGALISEFPLGTSSHAGNFPMRNRIISGLSSGTLVIEAAVKSGSLITAGIAIQQNREVFAIPGSIHNPLARGCHQLIRQGATLVETAQDIVDQLEGALHYQFELLAKSTHNRRSIAKMASQSPQDKPLPDDLSPAEKLLISALGFDLCSLDDLIERTGLPVGSLAGQLIGLEIKGLVQQNAAGYQRTL